jgi:NADH-quinone oxidoreductase subunit L
MTLPLVVLAVASVIGGFIGIEQFVGKQFGHEGETAALFDPFGPFTHAPVASILGLTAVVLGFALAYALYSKAKTDPLPGKLQGLATAMRNKFYFDELYEKLIALTQDALAKFVDAFDRWVIAGFMVRGTQGVTEIAGRALRLVQTGNLSTYTFLFASGVAVVLYLVLFR